MRIDVHAHYYPDAYLDTLARYGNEVTDIGRNLLAGDAAVELAARLSMMDEADVEMQVLSAGPLLPYFPSRGDAVEAARIGNDLYAELVARHPGRFAAFAALPLPHAEASLVEMARALDELSMVGVTVATSVLGKALTDPAFEPVFAELDRREAVLYIHPAGVGACSALIAAYGLTWPIGAVIEDTMVALHLIACDFPAKYPRVRFLLSHLGGAMPMILPRLDDHRYLFVSDTAEAPSITARRFWYDTVAHGHGAALRCAWESFGTDKLVLGSDYPYQQGSQYTNTVSYIQNAGLPETDVVRILDRNASVLLRLDERSAR